MNMKQFLEHYGDKEFLFQEAYKGVFTYQLTGPDCVMFSVQGEYRDTLTTYETPNEWCHDDSFLFKANINSGWSDT